MCTVSFIAVKDKVFLTSNRDEHKSRPSAFAPVETLINDVKVVYPKDPKAGGTWFAVNEFGTVTVLLNGAFEYHKSTGNYRRSRGLIVLDIIGSKTPLSAIKTIDLNLIEPFTLVLFADGGLFELRWDGQQKHLRQLDADTPYIWSSATLYTKEVMQDRENAFAQFLGNGPAPTGEAIIAFHTNKTEDQENGFVIDRGTGLKTFSVTQALLDETGISLCHKDLRTGTRTKNHLGMATKLCSPS